LEDATGKPPFPFFGRAAAPFDGLSAFVLRLRDCRAAAGARSDFAGAVAATRVRVGSTAGVGFAGLGAGVGAGAGGSAAGVVLRTLGSTLLPREGAPRRRAAARSLPLGGGSDPVTAAYPL
jgi:hypothetical protein